MKGLAIADGAGSKRPGVYLIEGKSGSDTATVKVRITDSKNISGDATLEGHLGGLTMKGTCPTSAGEHNVTVKISQLPDSIQWYKGDVSWSLIVPDLGSSVSLSNDTRLEVFVVLDTPSAFYSPPGVWVEALRFLCSNIGVIGLSDDADVAEHVANFCHSSHGLRYDTIRGAPSYGCNGSGGTFQLGDYLNAVRTTINCYDQAAAIQALCGAVGVPMSWLYIAPFGYMNSTNLVGIGTCNNPFFDSNGSAAVVPINDPDRTAFGNHAFCELDGKISDACAGPHRGTENRTQYCSASIDTVTTLYGPGFRAGTPADISGQAGVSRVV